MRPPHREIHLIERIGWLRAAVLSAIGARAGGSAMLWPTLRVTFWGAFGMAATAVIDTLVGRAV